ncbi:glycolate oxidase subunit GlcF [Desulfobacterota bacterium AH_259_B03_O07]|nr:glycolate oxidase subunit GlcF [Desulfobacterota bacterium AH_259_B03_O07]
MEEKTTNFQAFDEIDTPSMDFIKDCVHCGFCLSACPTYLETGNELDSPRGRIYLMKSALEGKIPMGGSLVKHLDMCLGCMACEPACPSGVDYSRLIEAARSQIERRYERPITDKLQRAILFSIFPYPKRLRFLLPFLYLYQATGLRRLVESTGILLKLSKKLATMDLMLPQINSSNLFSSMPNFMPAKGTKRHRVATLTGCVQSILFPKTNEATIRVLSENGCEVIVPGNQGCCGALSLHSGRISEARNFARSNIDVFEKHGVDTIIVNSAGCGSAMKEYGEILKDDPNYANRAEKISQKTKDVMEFLSEIGLSGELKRLKCRVTYQDACHIAHAQRIKIQPREIIKQIPGIEFVEMPESELCCGSAGIYNLIEPEMSEKLLNRKIENLKETNAELLVAGNPGCLLQIQKGIKQEGLNIKTVHPIELLDWAYKGEYI